MISYIGSTLTGLPGGSKAYFLTELLKELTASLVVVTSEDLEAEGLSADLDAWTGLLPSIERPAVIYFPEMDEALRLAALGRWSTEKRAVLLASKAALEKPIYSPQQLKNQTFELRPGS